jgi:hypothetical protein
VTLILVGGAGTVATALVAIRLPGALREARYTPPELPPGADRDTSDGRER